MAASGGPRSVGGRAGGNGASAALETLLYELAARGQVTVSSLGLPGHGMRWIVTVVDTSGQGGSAGQGHAGQGHVPTMRHYDGPDLYRTVRAAHGGGPPGSVP